jgi:hypothetical protein
VDEGLHPLAKAVDQSACEGKHFSDHRRIHLRDGFGPIVMRIFQ